MSTVDSATSSGFSSSLLSTVNGSNSTSGTTGTNGSSALTDEASVKEQENKFLTLLVSQLQNQDPLNPTDNAELTSQLAQLSTVTGVNKLNSTLETLQTSFQSSQALNAANMIGHGVLTPGKAIDLASSKAVFGVDLATPADSVTVSIRNSSGVLVHTIDLGAQDAGTVPMGWNGETGEVDASGKNLVLADGKYTFEVNATRAGVALDDASALTFGTVASVSTNASGVTLNLPGIGKISMADVKQVL